MSYNTIPGLLTGIGDAIREKTNTTGKINALDMPELIQSIETGIDTSDATAVAADIGQGKTAYVNGGRITGTIPIITGYEQKSGSLSDYLKTLDSTHYYVKYPFNNPKLYRAGAHTRCVFPKSDFGDAIATNVTSGKTFTSASGAKITGTGFTPGVPDLTNILCKSTYIYTVTATEGVITINDSTLSDCFIQYNLFPIFLASFVTDTNNSTATMIAYPALVDKTTLNDTSTIKYIASCGTSNGILLNNSYCVFSSINNTLTMTWNICDSSFADDAYNGNVPIKIETITFG